MHSMKEALAPEVREIKKVEKIISLHLWLDLVYKTKRSSLLRTPFCTFDLIIFYRTEVLLLVCPKK